VRTNDRKPLRRMGITLYEPAPIPPNEPERERAVEASGALTIRGDPALKALVEELRRNFRTSMAAVTIIYRDWQYLIATAGLPDGPYSRRTSFCGHVLAQPDKLFCVLDAKQDPRFAENPSVEEGLAVRFYAAAPLIADSGLPLGAICVFDSKPRPGLSADCGQRLVRAAERAMAVIAARGPMLQLAAG
jgi:GAF domain-containing protein